MSLFHPDYAKPGPGVSPDEPRKTGAARLFEVIGRDFGPFFVTGLLALLSALPFVVCLYLAVDTHALIFVLAGGVLGGMLAAPALCALADIVLRSLRDEPFYWWDAWRRCYKRNGKACLVPGAIFGTLIGLDLFLFMHLVKTSQLVLLMIALVFLCAVALYIVAQIALLELPLLGYFRNALLLAIGWLPRTLAAMVVLLGHSLLVYLFYPISAIEMLLLGSWFPILWALFLVYPAFEKSFHIEESIKKMNEEKYAQPQEPDEEK